MVDPPAHPVRNNSGPEVRLGILLWRTLVILLAAGGIVLAHGFPRHPVLPLFFIHTVQAILLAVYFFDFFTASRYKRVAIAGEKTDWMDIAVAVLAGMGLIAGLVYGQPESWIGFYLAIVLLTVVELWRMNVGLARRFYRPGILLPLSFLTMIIAGTLLLKVPLAVPDGHSISWLDALFTMTSAVCVTGLIVRDTATEFSWFGQAVIAIFIQLGGLGIIIFGSVFAFVLGGKISIRENITLSRMLNDLPISRIAGYVRFIVIFTIVIEFIAAAAMMTMWPDSYTFENKVGLSLFHSISAFCNAGFSLFSDSLQSFRYSPITHLIIVPLIVIGGLGFPVLVNLIQTTINQFRFNQSPLRTAADHSPDNPRRIPLAQRRLSLHTKIVLTTTAVLYIYGVVTLAAANLVPYLYTTFDQGTTANQRPLKPLSLSSVGGIIADASFMSVTARTAGFNTEPMEEIRPAGQFVLTTLMLVGASPGSTGGGMKTTTLAIMLLTVAATIRQRPATEAFSRKMSEQLVRKAATLGCGLLGLVCVATLLLSFSEPFPLTKVIFEVVSAATTTGLSLGITANLTAFGKIVIILTMFLGRIGPLALLATLMFTTRAARDYAYPGEEVVMG